jgi:hypothetical protein
MKKKGARGEGRRLARRKMTDNVSHLPPIHTLLIYTG